MPEPTLQATALRYAAGDLTPAESAAFEARLTHDQDARDALAEAVRLSAAALGCQPPAPDRTFRAAIRERLVGYCPAWLRRRAYRGHPLTWSALGAAAVAACTIIGLSLAQHAAPEPGVAGTATARTTPAPRVAPPRTELALAPAPREDEVPGDPTTWQVSAEYSVAERWADLSTPEHVGKLHDDEHRWRQKLRDACVLHALHGSPASTTTDHPSP